MYTLFKEHGLQNAPSDVDYDFAHTGLAHCNWTQL